MSRVSTTGDTGGINLQATRQNSSDSQFLHSGYDDTENYVHLLEGRLGRHVTRNLLQQGTERKRRAGVNVFWQREPQDIISGMIPLNITLPATADKMFGDSDQSVRIRFPNGISPNLQADFWFEMDEELVKHDY